ncbi:hypothetical protein HPB50_004244 [Hyalomma asiaticum]|uniref:Uncharacterized protein n=1 Tax=Hyalomma asiaticum TaxID=266040 RepID=A0ACB7TCC2_HYAAI|nr:hypothetical protein HPB50_004244 [Hyalomma asiaticum]
MSTREAVAALVRLQITLSLLDIALQHAVHPDGISCAVRGGERAVGQTGGESGTSSRRNGRAPVLTRAADGGSRGGAWSIALGAKQRHGRPAHLPSPSELLPAADSTAAAACL